MSKEKKSKSVLSSRSGNASGSDTSDPYSMTEEKLRARALKPNRGKYWPQFFCTLTGAICFGIVQGWSCPAIRQHLELKSQDDWFPSVAGLAPLGCSLGCVLLSALARRNGPRIVILFLSPFQFVCWVLISTLPSESLYRWMIFCSGFLSIGYIICGETLLWDSVHPGYTSQFMVLFQSSTILGVYLSFLIGLTPKLSITYYSVFGSVLVTITFIMYLCLPESPVHLYGKYPQKSEKALKFLRGETNIYDDMRTIKKDHELQSVDIAVKYMLMKKVIYKAVFVIIGLFFFRAFTGYFALISFGLTVMSGFGDDKDGLIPIDVIGKLEDAIILGLVLYVSKLCSCSVHYRHNYGVRIPLLTSSVLISFSLLLLTIYFCMRDYNILFHENNDWIKLIIDCFHIISYEVGYSLYPEVVLHDYLPFQIYPWIRLFATSMKWLFVYIMLMILLIIQNGSVWTWHVYLFLFTISFVGIIFNYFFVIESKGKTLMQIQALLGGNPIGSRSSRRAMYF